MLRRLSHLSRFVLSRGLFCCVLLLAIAGLLLLRAGEGGVMAPRFYDYAQVFLYAALGAFGCGTVGSLLTEDMMRHLGAAK